VISDEKKLIDVGINRRNGVVKNINAKEVHFKSKDFSFDSLITKHFKLKSYLNGGDLRKSNESNTTCNIFIKNKFFILSNK